MTQHLRRSRITKALVDRRASGADFPGAEKRLAMVRVAVLVDVEQARTPAGQAAALTALATCIRCFGNATLVADGTTSLIKPLSLGRTLGEAAVTLGASVIFGSPAAATHLITIGAKVDPGAPCIGQCWWDRWRAGVLAPWDDRPLGASGNPMAGVFAAALAVRQLFASVIGDTRVAARSLVASLWEPWLDPEAAAQGPDIVSLSPRLWFVGLGHLGQGILWNLGLLPVCGQIAVQDDQSVGEENLATGLLTTPTDVGDRKTRVAARWLDAVGWQTSIIERRHYGDIPLRDHDPVIVITSLDEPAARIKIAGAGFDYMVDAGVGHGPVDFESLQIRILKKGVDPRPFWSAPAPSKNINAMLQDEAYQAHQREFGECGTFSLAEASVAVPFVGAAVGALTIAQTIRLASMLPTPQIMQMDLGCPALSTVGGFNDAPRASFGSVEMRVA